MRYPRIRIVISEILQEGILMSDYKRKDLEKSKRKFSSLLRKYERKIFRLIYSYTGLKWKREEIRVWLFRSKHESIADPFLLNTLSEDWDFILFEFIRLLVNRETP